MATAAPTVSAELAQDIAELGPWFHNLHLPGGVETAPDHFLGDFPSVLWRDLAPHLPSDLTGWSALDIGCNAGFYSFELARRGARVTAVDHDEHYLAQARWAARRFGLESQITFRRQGVYDLARESTRYDLVLFMGVFYHLRYPLLGLDAVARRVGRLLVFQSLSLPGEEVAKDLSDRPIEERDHLAAPEWPRLAFIEHSFAADPTNWWVPNLAAIEALLRSAGLRILGRPSREVYLCGPGDPGAAAAAAEHLMSALGSPPTRGR